DPLLVDALTELHQRVLVQPDPRDVSAFGLVDDGLGRRPERGALRTQDERLELAFPVEVRVGLHQVIDEAYGELRRGDADALVDVAVDHVVATLLALDHAGLAAPDVVTDGLLEREGDVFGDVAGPRAFVEPFDEAALAATGAGVLAQLRQGVEQR